MKQNKWIEWEGPNVPVTAIQALQEQNRRMRSAEILVGMHS